jgi:hypothetical protein
MDDILHLAASSVNLLRFGLLRFERSRLADSSQVKAAI